MNENNFSYRVSHNADSILINKYIEMIKLLNLYLNHFPKNEKHALCATMRLTAYELYDIITECNKSYFKKTSLTKLDITHEKLRMQIYLAYELGYFDFSNGAKQNTDFDSTGAHRYLVINKLINELGRMIGGWIKKINKIQ